MLTGEVLSALEMVSSISQVVAPIQGLILTLYVIHAASLATTECLILEG
jgi:hypothetical protein